MVQSLQDPKRYRGYVLTLIGWQKLQACIQALELRTGVHQSARAIATRIQLAEPDGIHPMTVRKLLRGQQGVDRRSLDQVFRALHLVLEAEDYAHANLANSRKIVAFNQRSSKARFKESLEKGSPLSEAHFYGRVEERSQLRQQIILERCRMIAVLGAAGIGKTALVKNLTLELDPRFECIIWRSLHHAPSLVETLTSLLQSLHEKLGSNPQLPTTIAGLMTHLFFQL
jgi:hypothetical protein